MADFSPVLLWKMRQIATYFTLDVTSDIRYGLSGYNQTIKMWKVCISLFHMDQQTPTTFIYIIIN